MKVNVYDAQTFQLVNVRYVEEVVEQEYEHAADTAMFEAECDRAEDELKDAGRYWIGSVYLTPAR